MASWYNREDMITCDAKLKSRHGRVCGNTKGVKMYFTRQMGSPGSGKQPKWRCVLHRPKREVTFYGKEVKAGHRPIPAAARPSPAPDKRDRKPTTA